MERKGSGFWFGFALGLFLGGLLWYWQKSTAADEGALDLLDKYAATMARLEKEESGAAVATDSEATTAVAPQVDMPPDEPAADVDAEEVTEVIPAANAAAAEAAETPPPDDLTQIKGIGPVYAGRLQAAGITTFAALAQQTPDYVAAVVGRKEWQAADTADWIAAAAELAETSDNHDA